MNEASTLEKGTQHEKLMRYKEELANELRAILTYWSEYTVDKENDGFYGSVSNGNRPDKKAPKGIVLNSRILWTFSAAYRYTADPSHLDIATRAFEYILKYFIDKEYGGAYWSVDAQGNMLEGRKQIYGLAFCIYGMAEYYSVTKNEPALMVARRLYAHIEEHSLDRIKNGYVEAFTREWEPLQDLRLSEKDDNEKKTMNTHLHIVEAYANLYKSWPDPKLRESIINLLEIFSQHIVNTKTHHLNLFMDEDWEVRSTLVSYGHDIEAAWLLQECAEIIQYDLYKEHYKKQAVMLADATAEGLDSDGGLWYEYEPASQKLVREKHWWPQSEAMVGFFNAWQQSGDEKYLSTSLSSWEFIKQHIKDRVNGEWFWGIYDGYEVIEKDKAGFWKCPYHNGRACLEIIYRMDKTSSASPD